MVEQDDEGIGLQTEKFESILCTRPGRFYWFLTGRPWWVVIISLAVAAQMGSALPRLYKDTSAEAFIADDNPAVVYRKKVEETFGLSDPVIVAVCDDGPKGIFTAEGLNTVAHLSRQIARVEGVDPERVTSLYTESNIVGDAAGLTAMPFFEESLDSDEAAREVFEAVKRFPLFMGSIVADDGSSTLIVAELLDAEMGNQVYHQVSDLGSALDNGIEVYVAGEGAVAEHLGEYIDDDSRRLYPIIGLTIVLTLLVAFRTKRGIAIPALIVLCSTAFALGAMAASGVPIYIITNALPVIIIAIGVADGIHIVSEYYDEIAVRPDSDSREPVVRAMVELWRAIFFTSLTDAAGFLALALVSFMPPMRAFGLFAAVGVTMACAFSLITMPAILALFKPRPSPAFQHHLRKGRDVHYDRFGSVMSQIGRRVIRNPHAVLWASLVLAVAGLVGASRLQIDYARINYFHESEPIYQADRIINERFDGSNFVDVVVEANEPDGLLNAQYLRKIEELQRYVERLPNVGGTTSVVDYVKQMNRAIWEDDEDHYILPEDSDLIAQYFLLFSATGDPEELGKVVDYDYRMANVRIALTSGVYSDIAEVIVPLREYLEREFADSELKAAVAGRANVTYEWMQSLASSHFLGIFVASVAVWLFASYSFRSFVGGTFAVVPVFLAILCIYAIMGVFGIWLGIGTSMFAAIGIGISVNFAIHTLHRTIELVEDYGEDLAEALRDLFPATGRALFFNFVAVFFGFGVLMSSQISALKDFGLLVAVATLISFLASVTTLPAMLLVFRPKFLAPGKSTSSSGANQDSIS